MGDARRWRVILTAVLGLLVWSAPARAAERLVVLTGDLYPPYTGLTLPGRGLATQIVEAAFAEAGVPVTVKFVPWMRAEVGARRGEAAASFPFIPTMERAQRFYYSDALFHEQVQLWVLERATWTYRYGPRDLKGRSGCTPFGYALEAVIKEAVAAQLVTRMEAPETMQACFAMLERKRVDFVVTSRFIVQWLQKTGAVTAPVKAQERLIADNTLHLIVSRSLAGGAALISEFDSGLAKLRGDGRLQAILDRELK